MGLSGSKVAQEDKTEIATGSVPTTPILTPKNKKCVEEIVDPRSPSLHILRTPVASCSSPLTPAPNTCDTFNINSPVLLKNLNDPRSPTVEFTRTPIMAVDDTDLLRRVHMKNLKSIKKIISEMPSQIPPKLLESSPIRPKPNVNKRRSFAGLLETNMDYVETDLDAVILSKSSPNLLKSASPNKTELKAKFLESVQREELSEHQCLTSTPVHTEIPAEIPEVNVLQVVETICHDNSTKEPKLNIVQDLEVDDDGLVIQPSFQHESQIEEHVMVTESAVTPKKVCNLASETIAATVQEFEKKVNHLIYTEEKHIAITPPVNKQNALQAKPASYRTPLGVRNGDNGQGVGKSKPKLRVSDKPRRAKYAVSKIPVFNSRNVAECENNPPTNMLAEGRKIRRAQWDNDNTLVI